MLVQRCVLAEWSEVYGIVLVGASEGESSSFEFRHSFGCDDKGGLITVLFFLLFLYD
jgi:hypothetical protein